jgi:MFS family permease
MTAAGPAGGGDARPAVTGVSSPVGRSERVPSRRRWWTLAVIAIAQLMVVLDGTVVTIALPSAQRDLHISDANRQWAITAYTLAFGGLLLVGGRIADYAGRKRRAAQLWARRC